MELSHLDPFTLADSGDYPPLVVVNEVRTLKSRCAGAKRRSRWQFAGGAPKDRRSRGHGAFRGRRTARPDRLRLPCVA